MKDSMTITLPMGTLEGTTAMLSTWLVAVGDEVKKGDPIVELETDKVSMEVCAETDGSIEKIVASTGDNVDEKTVLGYLTEVGMTECSASTPSIPDGQAEVALKGAHHEAVCDAQSKRHLIGPAVRKLLRRYDLSIDAIEGSGKGGRVTRDDILTFVAARDNGALGDTQSEWPPKLDDSMNRQIIPHTPMRKAIANHMVESLLHTSPHVTSVFEMDMGRIIEHRKQCKMGFSEAGVNLTFTAYFLAASAQAIQKVPVINARFYDDHLDVFSHINIGVGTALGDDGLVVPVVNHVEEKNLFEIASALQQQTDKARHGKLTAADLKGGTFTISNHGVSGSLFAAPIIINQPQVAILGIGKLEKRAVVETINGEEAVVIRPKCYVSLSIDHRALDAYQTNLFLAHFVEAIEHWGEEKAAANTH